MHGILRSQSRSISTLCAWILNTETSYERDPHEENLESPVGCRKKIFIDQTILDHLVKEQK